MARFRLLLLGFLLILPSMVRAANTNSLSLLDGERVVPAGSYVAWRVPADENPAQAGRMVGDLASKEGSNSRFAVAVLTESDFTSWKKGYRAYPVYSVRQVDRVELRARLPRPDVYYLVISNPFAPPHASTIRGTLRLLWVPATNAVASSAPAGGDPVRRDLIWFGAVLLLAVALATWSIYEERNATAIAPEKRAA